MASLAVLVLVQLWASKSPLEYPITTDGSLMDEIDDPGDTDDTDDTGGINGDTQVI